jgi:hypothetical protein
MSNWVRLKVLRATKELAGWNHAQLPRSCFYSWTRRASPQALCSPRRGVSAISWSSLCRGCWTRAVTADPVDSVRAGLGLERDARARPSRGDRTIRLGRGCIGAQAIG